MTVEPGTLCTFCSSHAPKGNHWGFLIMAHDQTKQEAMVVCCTNPMCNRKFRRGLEMRAKNDRSWANILDIFFEGTDPLDITFR
jgi:hypothetical protein